MPGIADKFGRASLPTETSVATTVKTTRAAGVLVLEAFDLSKYSVDTPVFFVTYKKTTDPVTGLVSITNLVSWKALVNPGANTLTNLTVQPGYVDGGNAVGDFIECIPTSAWENSLIDGIFVGHNPDGSFKKSQLQADLGNDGRLVDTLDELTGDFVFTGGIWSLTSGLNGAMTALAAYINGYKNTLAAIAARAFTINKDTYIDILKDPSTHAFSVVYTEVANGAAAPALAANSIRLAKVITNGSTITSVVQFGLDANGGNRIYPNAPVTGKNVDLLTFEKIRLKLSGSTGLNSTGATLNFAVTDYVQGSKLSRSGNAVLVGAGVSRVKITMKVFGDGGSSAPYLFVRIRKNGSDIDQILGPAGGTAFASAFMQDEYDVKQGDLLTIFADCGGGSMQVQASRQSSFTVEVLG